LEALLQEVKPRPLAFHADYSTSSQDLVKNVVDLESKLAQATPDEEDAQDVTKYYNPLSFAEAESLLPQLSLNSVVSSLAPQNYSPGRIIVGSPSYLERLSAILEESTAETLQAYFVWKTVQRYAYEIEDEALKPLLRFNNELHGKDPDALEERWRTCVRVIDSGLGELSFRLNQMRPCVASP
jgi:endothelin-converting enzyme